MVSSRCQKRFVALVFLSCVALVFIYKIQQERSDFITRGLKQTKDFSSVNRDRHKSTRNDGEDPTEDDEDMYGNDNSTDLNIYNATDPPVKLHRGLEGDDEVEDTFDWLNEHGATPPPGPSPIPKDEESLTTPMDDNEKLTNAIDDGEELTTNRIDDKEELRTNPINNSEELTTPSQIVSTNQSSVSSTASRSTKTSTSKRVKTPGAEVNTKDDNDESTTQNQIVSTIQSSISSTAMRSTKKSTSKRVKTPDAEVNTKGDNEKTTTPSQILSTTQSLISSTAMRSTKKISSKHVKNPGTPLKSTIERVLASTASTKAQQNHTSFATETTETSTQATNFDLTSPYTTPSTTGTPTPVYTTAPSPNTCKLPKLNPWDPSISHLITDVGNDPGCRSGYPLPAFDVINNRLVLTGEVNGSSIDFSEVDVATIHRDNTNDNHVYYLQQGNPFNASSEEFQPSNVINKSDFLILKYKLKTGKEVTSYLPRVVPQQDAIDESYKIRQEFKRQGNDEGLGLNVVMLGFDSVSAANFRRKMPKSINFLKNSLKTYFISGQSIVGDATTPALTAMLTGLYESEPPEGRQGYDNSAPIDKWPWIMKQYKEHGYVTMMSEDDPTMSAFNLRLKGFEEPPAHHYGRPFWLALEEKYERDEPGLCSRSTFMVNYTLDYVLSYFPAYPYTPKFAFAFMSYLTHAHPNHLSYADNDIVRLLRAFVDKNYHNNTVVILFGDHGSRNDDVRNTMQGKLEERLPWLSVSVPPWLEKKYPDITSALEHNQHVITSPFDLHATLRHVLTYPEEPQGEKTQSLFKKLNYTRTCSEAGVGEHWCPCLEFTEVDTAQPDVRGGAEMAVKYINDVILNRTKLLRTSCARVQLKKILKASSYKPNEKVQRFSSTNQDSDRAVNFGFPTSDSAHYRINFMTSPGDALFEATVAITDDQKVIVNPNLSRTNVYGNQPKCILRKEPYARKFCYCKSLLH